MLSPNTTRLTAPLGLAVALLLAQTGVTAGQDLEGRLLYTQPQDSDELIRYEFDSQTLETIGTVTLDSGRVLEGIGALAHVPRHTNLFGFWLDPDDPDSPFPPVSLALSDPDGLLAVGGDLSPRRLLRAYAAGIFPWYSQAQPILWWSPDPRSVLLPAQLRISRSLRKTLRRQPFRITFDQAFEQVMRGCAQPRRSSNETWITEEMIHAYYQLHRLGHAHSAEAWQGENLVGGLYGVNLGQVFFGESMFSRVSDASKVAFVHLLRFMQQRGISLVDCQVASDHLDSLGAVPMSRNTFIQQLRSLTTRSAVPGPWLAQPIETDILIHGPA